LFKIFQIPTPGVEAIAKYSIGGLKFYAYLLIREGGGYTSALEARVHFK
jgi:hypothetical protein